MIEIRSAITYQKVCAFCGSVMRVGYFDMKKRGARPFRCLCCKHPIRFKSDYGILLDDVKVSLKPRFEVATDGKEED